MPYDDWSDDDEAELEKWCEDNIYLAEGELQDGSWDDEERYED